MFHVAKGFVFKKKRDAIWRAKCTTGRGGTYFWGKRTLIFGHSNGAKIARRQNGWPVFFYLSPTVDFCRSSDVLKNIDRFFNLIHNFTKNFMY